MVKLTKSLSHYLWVNHKDIIGLIMLGHTELLTDEIWNNYIVWCQTEDAKPYLNDAEGEDGDTD